MVDDTKTSTEALSEQKTVAIADLPILIDSTSIIIHPIGNYIKSKNRSDYFKSSSYESDSFSTVNHTRNQIRGLMSNIKFQHIDSNALKPLTDKKICISSMNFLREVFEATAQGYFLYLVYDKDTNVDGVLNYKDLESLYMSNLDGTAFRKLSPDNQDLKQWKIIIEAKKLYFKSIEDSDKNGEFDNKDTLHYFYLDLNAINSQVTEYYPI
ncbi:hypothetical protein [Psychroserpens sp. SPM9]|uniref:hypothetical protein n=1 Tax=Psychroserpens sp. SPM9 TaxID=2975598 RepID=UPI0021A88925|nr:hypothetical protein [Psychroserpens sp. SPM9]MDG5492673.1 hypothetical protein [Psychroserpens sp. SPM9]